MLLPSSAELVRAFIKDLGTVLDVTDVGAKPTVHRTLWGANAATILPPGDCFIVGVKPLQVGGFALSSTNETTSSIGLANNTIKDSVVCAINATTFLADMIPMRWFWGSGVKLYYNTSGGTGILLILEMA